MPDKKRHKTKETRNMDIGTLKLFDENVYVAINALELNQQIAPTKSKSGFELTYDVPNFRDQHRASGTEKVESPVVDLTCNCALPCEGPCANGMVGKKVTLYESLLTDYQKEIQSRKGIETQIVPPPRKKKSMRRGSESENSHVKHYEAKEIAPLKKKDIVQNNSLSTIDASTENSRIEIDDESRSQPESKGLRTLCTSTPVNEGAKLFPPRNSSLPDLQIAGDVISVSKSMGTFEEHSLPKQSVGTSEEHSLPKQSMGTFEKHSLPKQSMGTFEEHSLPKQSMGTFEEHSRPKQIPRREDVSRQVKSRTDLVDQDSIYHLSKGEKESAPKRPIRRKSGILLIHRDYSSDMPHMQVPAHHAMFSFPAITDVKRQDDLVKTNNDIRASVNILDWSECYDGVPRPLRKADSVAALTPHEHKNPSNLNVRSRLAKTKRIQTLRKRINHTLGFQKSNSSCWPKVFGRKKVMKQINSGRFRKRSAQHTSQSTESFATIFMVNEKKISTLPENWKHEGISEGLFTADAQDSIEFPQHVSMPQLKRKRKHRTLRQRLMSPKLLLSKDSTTSLDSTALKKAFSFLESALHPSGSNNESDTITNEKSHHFQRQESDDSAGESSVDLDSITSANSAGFVQRTVSHDSSAEEHFFTKISLKTKFFLRTTSIPDLSPRILNAFSKNSSSSSSEDRNSNDVLEGMSKPGKFSNRLSNLASLFSTEPIKEKDETEAHTEVDAQPTYELTKTETQIGLENTAQEDSSYETPAISTERRPSIIVTDENLQDHLLPVGNINILGGTEKSTRCPVLKEKNILASSSEKSAKGSTNEESRTLKHNLLSPPEILDNVEDRHTFDVSEASVNIPVTESSVLENSSALDALPRSSKHNQKYESPGKLDVCKRSDITHQSAAGNDSADSSYQTRDNSKEAIDGDKYPREFEMPSCSTTLRNDNGTLKQFAVNVSSLTAENTEYKNKGSLIVDHVLKTERCVDTGRTVITYTSPLNGKHVKIYLHEIDPNVIPLEKCADTGQTVISCKAALNRLDSPVENIEGQVLKTSLVQETFAETISSNPAVKSKDVLANFREKCLQISSDHFFGGPENSSCNACESSICGAPIVSLETDLFREDAVVSEELHQKITAWKRNMYNEGYFKTNTRSKVIAPEDRRRMRANSIPEIDFESEGESDDANSKNLLKSIMDGLEKKIKLQNSEDTDDNCFAEMNVPHVLSSDNISSINMKDDSVDYLRDRAHEDHYLYVRSAAVIERIPDNCQVKPRIEIDHQKSFKTEKSKTKWLSDEKNTGKVKMTELETESNKTKETDYIYDQQKHLERNNENVLKSTSTNKMDAIFADKNRNFVREEKFVANTEEFSQSEGKERSTNISSVTTPSKHARLFTVRVIPNHLWRSNSTKELTRINSMQQESRDLHLTQSFDDIPAIIHSVSYPFPESNFIRKIHPVERVPFHKSDKTLLTSAPNSDLNYLPNIYKDEIPLESNKSKFNVRNCSLCLDERNDCCDYFKNIPKTADDDIELRTKENAYPERNLSSVTDDDLEKSVFTTSQCSNSDYCLGNQSDPENRIITLTDHSTSKSSPCIDNTDVQYEIGNTTQNSASNSRGIDAYDLTRKPCTDAMLDAKLNNKKCVLNTSKGNTTMKDSCAMSFHAENTSNVKTSSQDDSANQLQLKIKVTEAEQEVPAIPKFQPDSIRRNVQPVDGSSDHYAAKNSNDGSTQIVLADVPRDESFGNRVERIPDGLVLERLLDSPKVDKTLRKSFLQENSDIYDYLNDLKSASDLTSRAKVIARLDSDETSDVIGFSILRSDTNCERICDTVPMFETKSAFKDQCNGDQLPNEEVKLNFNPDEVNQNCPSEHELTAFNQQEPSSPCEIELSSIIVPDRMKVTPSEIEIPRSDVPIEMIETDGNECRQLSDSHHDEPGMKNDNAGGGARRRSVTFNPHLLKITPDPPETGSTIMVSCSSNKDIFDHFSSCEPVSKTLKGDSFAFSPTSDTVNIVDDSKLSEGQNTTETYDQSVSHNNEYFHQHESHNHNFHRRESHDELLKIVEANRDVLDSDETSCEFSSKTDSTLLDGHDALLSSGIDESQQKSTRNVLVESANPDLCKPDSFKSSLNELKPSGNSLNSTKEQRDETENRDAVSQKKPVILKLVLKEMSEIREDQARVVKKSYNDFIKPSISELSTELPVAKVFEMIDASEKSGSTTSPIEVAEELVTDRPQVRTKYDHHNASRENIKEPSFLPKTGSISYETLLDSVDGSCSRATPFLPTYCHARKALFPNLSTSNLSTLEQMDDNYSPRSLALGRPTIILQTWFERQKIGVAHMKPARSSSDLVERFSRLSDTHNSPSVARSESLPPRQRLDTPSPGTPVDQFKEDTVVEQPPRQEERVQKDRSLDVYPETLRQRQRPRNMAPSPSKVDIKNWNQNGSPIGEPESPASGKKFLPSVKALRSQFETGKNLNSSSNNGSVSPTSTFSMSSSSSNASTGSTHGSGIAPTSVGGGGLRAVDPIATLSRKLSGSSLASSSLEKSSSNTSLNSAPSTENMLDGDPHDPDEPVEPIFCQFQKVDEELRELMSRPTSTSGWDPRSLLKRLYYVPEAPRVHSKGHSYISIEGYLEKLPSGRKKATFWNAWKRRYFVAKDGVLYYYQNSQCDKQSLKLTLMGGKVETMEGNMVGVDDGKGHYVVVRCSSRSEADRWRRALESHLVEDFASQYVQPNPMPTNPSLFRDTLIIDIGSCSVRAGVLSSQATLPQLFFPSVVATDRESRRQVWGQDALAPETRTSSSLSFPMKPSHRISKYSVDLTAVSSLLAKTFSDLKVDPKNYNLQISVPRVLNQTTQSELLKTLFEKFGVKGVNVTNQSILALYAYNATSGIVVDIGERMDIVPVIDGYIVEGGVSRVPYGGCRILDHLRQFLYLRNVSLVNDVESYIIRHVLESSCYCAQHYNTEKARCTNHPENFEKTVSLKEFFPNTAQCPYDAVELDFGRFQATEGLFNPDAWGLDHPGLHKLVHKAIQECSMDIRKEMSRSIFLAGGVTQLPGLADRLTTELDNLTPPAIRPKVHVSPYRYHAAYIGACTLAESPAFSQTLITRENWAKNGNAALRKWAL